MDGRSVTGATEAVALRDHLRRSGAAIACPLCREPLELGVGRDARCRACRTAYPWRGSTWDLVPAVARESGDPWASWRELQANGSVAYREDPRNNLSVGERQDCRAFAEFCRLDGRVLDVGCGWQSWPAYFALAADDADLVGIDPLIEQSSHRYLQLRAVAEFLPLRGGGFDQVLFATSLDHVVDPVAALREARRVCRPGGAISLWVGEKRFGAPPPAETPEWYRGLRRPEGAEDPFHVRRLDPAELPRLAVRAGLSQTRSEIHPVDEWRTNHFCRLESSA